MVWQCVGSLFLSLGLRVNAKKAGLKKWLPEENLLSIFAAVCCCECSPLLYVSEDTLPPPLSEEVCVYWVVF